MSQQQGSESIEPHRVKWELPGTERQPSSPVHLPLSDWRQWEQNHEKGKDVIREEISRLDDLQEMMGRGLAQPSQLPPARPDQSPQRRRDFDAYDVNHDGKPLHACAAAGRAAAQLCVGYRSD